ncbi:tetratricopeptide repeat-containing glycosyltransferase family protein [Rhodopila sp.]|uniref:tetratricopeptide repeat-containing glycosyltransferase family protein n=1 Tax=Rhodopila sp. TaxID=2480087 RepID=UPI002CEFF776|nr:tetratricopeptide repeat-containing glycosyltransferase family protein [Rhodopila sp.]HVZ06855.1 tetratricopeptide repeat-containing glycosyltransferase family protein [Rhodopila sp.]
MRAKLRRLARAFEQAAADHRAGRLMDAERGYRNILDEAPDHPDALHGFGLLALQCDRAPAAIAYLGMAMRARPDDARIHLDLGLALRACGHLDESRGAIRSATLLDPDDPLAYAALGDSLVLLNRLDEAVNAYRDALRLAPELAVVRSSLGFLLRERGSLDEAVIELRHAVTLQPENAAARVALGASLSELGQLDEAAAELRAALDLAPDDAMALNNLGLVQHTQGDVAGAVASLTAGRRLRPDLATIAANLAAALRDAGALDAALAEAEAALRIEPDNADAHFVLGTIHLLRGDLTRGWAGFAWRHRIRGALVRPPLPPKWDGSPLDGRTLLIRPEQGLGDVIQFCRYAPLIRGGRVIIAAPEPLLRLLATLPGDVEVVPQDIAPPADVACSILDLPHLFGTTLESIPADIPYLSADSVAADAWRPRLQALQGKAVGLCWAGGARYQHDRRRSIPSAFLRSLAAVPDVTWVSLQKDAAGTPALPLVDWTAELADFADTAALVSALDLVITVDTAIAHLAGAVGRPVWLLNRFGGDWRWLLDRSDSPWYPTLRQFRQPRLNDWASVLDQVRRALVGAALSRPEHPQAG